jgi:UDP:flavonoid glycosyltransferase YjiC (YdhE family)
MPVALIVTADQGGNLPPMLGIGAALKARGWTVVVHGDPRALHAARSAGLEAVAAAGLPYDSADRRTGLQVLRELPRFWADRSRGRDAVAVAKRMGAAVVIVDGLLVGALAECERAGLRTVAVAHTTWEGFRPFMGGLMGGLMRLRGTRALAAVTTADRLLITSDPALGKPMPLPPNATLTGPVLQELPHREAPSSRPLIVVSLSTVAFPGQREVLQRVLDAVATLPVDVLASTARSVDREGFRVGSNTTLEQFVDHHEALPKASVFVGHGGHAGTVRALAHGVPLLILPMHPMMDQPRIGRAVAAAGAGLALPNSANPDAIRGAVQRLLDEPSFTASADRLGRNFNDGAATSADIVERLTAETTSTSSATAGPQR